MTIFQKLYQFGIKYIIILLFIEVNKSPSRESFKNHWASSL